MATSNSSDERVILAGTGQNLAGLLVAVVATFATQVLITRTLGASSFGIVTVATQAAFVIAAATRFGMDMAAVRRVAIDVGAGERDRVRAVVVRAAGIAAAASVVVGGAIFLVAGPLGRSFTDRPDLGRDAFRAAALALPFAALVQVYLGATRGLKVMRHTLSVYWIGQPVAWIALMLAAWALSKTASAAVLAYAGSWALATAAAAWLWRRETAGFGHRPPGRGEVRGLVRYGAPRAPAALFSQLLFWTDLFVLARYAPSGEVGVYSAAVRSAQLVLLFLVSVNLMFSPFVADLHARGERARLDALFKSLTRWALAATVPVLVVLAVAPGPVLRLFGGGFEGGHTALLILAAGQLVNVATGSVGFILIMVGRTGWDLVVYAASLAFDVAVAVALVPRWGMEGAALAGALTLGLSNLARLALVWRFLRIQPFTRDYARLALPAATALLVALAAHAALSGGAWQVDLVVTAGSSMIAYAVVLVAAGLPPAERRAALRLVRGAASRRPPGG